APSHRSMSGGPRTAPETARPCMRGRAQGARITAADGLQAPFRCVREQVFGDRWSSRCWSISRWKSGEFLVWCLTAASPAAPCQRYSAGTLVRNRSGSRASVEAALVGADGGIGRLRLVAAPDEQPPGAIAVLVACERQREAAVEQLHRGVQ